MREEFDAALATEKALRARTPEPGIVFAGLGKDGVELNDFVGKSDMSRRRTSREYTLNFLR